jgi:energy-coupling factor transport system substrate-specific component
MSWPLASFALVAAVLAVGWLAFERSRPSARMVALVATLSALAALGRDAFAALDEVKPITAMTFVVGYCLGPLPGFTVGAIGMLASNMLLGQGPWTPWQMAAWGIVGLLGAATGKLARRRLGRLSLALGCALAALIAKETMNLYGWTIGAAHTPAALLLEVAKGLPFDAVDVVSTLLFGLAFGPELGRLLMRLQARTTVEWRQAGAIVPAALALLVVVSLVRAAPANAIPRKAVLARAVAYLRAAQKQDGGYGPEAGARSAELYTAWAAIGLAAAGRRPLHFLKDGHSPLSALRAGADTLESVGDVERTILALRACGVSAGTLAGRDLATRLTRAVERDGAVEGQVNLTAFGILALRASGDRSSDPDVRAAGRWLVTQQNKDGGFSFATRGDASEVDVTAAAIEGLVAAGDAGTVAVSRAVAFLRDAESGSGGFPLQPGEEPNAQSTAWAVQALVAAGQPLASGGRSPISYLERLAGGDGSIRYAQGNPQTPVWVTAEALAALARRPLPVEGPAAAPRAAARRTVAPSAAGSSGVQPSVPEPRAGRRSGAGSSGVQPSVPERLAARAILAVAAFATRCIHAVSALMGR